MVNRLKEFKDIHEVSKFLSMYIDDTEFNLLSLDATENGYELRYRLDYDKDEIEIMTTEVSDYLGENLDISDEEAFVLHYFVRDLMEDEDLVSDDVLTFTDKDWHWRSITVEPNKFSIKLGEEPKQMDLRLDNESVRTDNILTDKEWHQVSEQINQHIIKDLIKDIKDSEQLMVESSQLTPTKTTDTRIYQLNGERFGVLIALDTNDGSYEIVINRKDTHAIVNHGISDDLLMELVGTVIEKSVGSDSYEECEECEMECEELNTRNVGSLITNYSKVVKNAMEEIMDKVIGSGK